MRGFLAFWLVVSAVAGSSLPVGAAEPPRADLEALDRLYFGDEVVESATRAPKPLRQIAENATIVTAAEIRAMNAHTLAEVLDRVTGVFVQWFGYHFGAVVLPHILGSDEPDLVAGGDSRHIAVFLDGMPWNSLTSGPYLETIPVEIIDRIEILKGPGSSTWGSSLGGVINILTKGTGPKAVPHGTLSYSYGERGTWDGRAEGAGAAGPVGYYLYGGAQHAEWDRPRAEFENQSGFAKATARLGRRANLTLSGGYAKPDLSNVGLPAYAARVDNLVEAGFGRAALDLALSPALGAHLALYRYDQRIDQPTRFSGVRPSWWEDDYGEVPSEGAVYRHDIFKEKHEGLQARGTWSSRWGTAVVGVDYDRNGLTQIRKPNVFDPSTTRNTPSLDRLGVYLNDTFLLGPATVTAGLRYDDTSRTSSFWSPSLGVTVQAAQDTVIRALAARGFAYPALSNYKFNPNLDPERLWSYQLGAETKALPWLWLKLTGFLHDVANFVEWKDEGPTNSGRSRRAGVELEAETAPKMGITLQGGGTYIFVDRPANLRDQEVYQVNLGLAYQGFLRAALHGHLVWWDYGAGYAEGDHTDFIWDLAISKTIWSRRDLAVEFFGTVRNLFNGKRSDDLGGGTERGTESRWVEGGARFRF